MGMVERLAEAGIATRMQAKVMPHDGTYICDAHLMVHIAFKAMTRTRMMVYGQTKVAKVP